MNDTVQSDTPEPVSEPTLDEVIGEFSAQPQTPPAQAPAAEPTAAPSVPQPPVQAFDPLDQESVNQYVQQSAQGYTALTSQIQDLNQKLTQYEQSQAQAKVEADIKTAVTKVNEKLNADPMMVELALEKFAREKPGFQQIWDNRHSNPQAFDKALNAVTNELQGKFSVRQDSQLVENQRAAQSSQQSSATSEPVDEWADLTPGTPEWNAKWEALKAG